MNRCLVFTAVLLFAVWWLAAPVVPHDALAEVNACRAQKGLPPYTLDPQLQEGARQVAVWRAEHRCHGHSPNDFRFLPARARADAAGCAAWPAPMGWGSCETYSRSYRHAGAAWAMGRDGKRYMHLFVRR